MKTNKRFIKNTAWMVGEKVVQMAISLVISMITSRYLGPENYGIINYIGAYVAFFTPIVSLGLDSILIKYIVTDPDNKGEYIGTCLLMRLITSTISIVGILILILSIDGPDTLLLIVGVLQGLKLYGTAFDVINLWYQSNLQSKVPSIIALVAYVLVSIYKILLLVYKCSVEWFASAQSLDILMISAMYLIAYKINKGPKIRFSVKAAKKILKESYHFILSGMMVVLYGQMDKIMIGSMLSKADAGLYSAALRVCDLWVFIPMAIINSARPVIMEARDVDYNDYIYKIKKIYAIIIWLGIAAGIGITSLSKYIIWFLYGEEFLGATNTLRIASWYTMFSMLGSARGTWIVCENKNKYVKYYLAIGCVVNFILNYTLIPVIGIEGAATATLITQITTSLIAPSLFKETRINTKYVLESAVFKGILYGKDKRNLKKEQNTSEDSESK